LNQIYVLLSFISIVTGWTTRIWFTEGMGKRFFPICHRVQTGSGAHQFSSPRGA